MMEVPYHYQFRIIVIGDSMVGKSSLLKTFSEGAFGEMEPTVGVDFFSKIIQIHPKHNYTTDSFSDTRLDQEDNIIVKLQIWDTAGQERFKSIVTSYYRNSVGIVLVYDVTNRESYDHLIDWFTEACSHVEPGASSASSSAAQSSNPIKNAHHFLYTSTPISSPAMKTRGSEFCDSNNMSTPCNGHTMNDSSNLSFNRLTRQQSIRRDRYKMAYLVLGCKTDLEEQREVSYDDGKAFADQYGFKFIETSSKMLYNVNKAFQILAEEIYDKISECGRANRLHRTASGGHLTFDETHSHTNEGIRIGPLLENSSRHLNDKNRVRLLEAQPVSGFLGGCC